MPDDYDDALVRVRADTAAFKQDVAEMRASLDGPLQAGADRAGRGIESALLRAVRSGKLGFEDLKRVALAVMDEIAAAAIKAGVQSVLTSIASAAAGSAGAGSGAPGRATGGPVSPARPYWVGERGPELFVPTASGRIEPAGAGTGMRTVNVAIRVQADAGTAPAALARSSRQVARAVRAALETE